ncbi:PAS domain-containing sensor histidine kinase [Nitratidesulfovibrio vulgaris]|uniref:PAS domain-containing sensor histidine kinase n=1 Tax=Nitratidesulfovibrio vulgaris TaxID=881 RepID=UPI0023012D27|nr:PAS domain S-box protein [Nitratidesulfovibrio vulgaris]WCB46496.1 PAS domain S-box protein [Nitratidesulfovibrio vulgaris]
MKAREIQGAGSDNDFWAKRFEVVNAAAKHMFYDYDLRRDSIEWFGAVSEVLGYDASEIEGPVQIWIDMLSPEDSPRVLDQLRKSCMNGDAFDIEYRLRRKDGQFIHVHDSGVFLLDESGRPFQMLGIIQDVSVRKQAELALAASENRYRTLFETAQDTILVMDGLTIVDCNPSATVLLGGTREDVVGRLLSDFSSSVQGSGESGIAMFSRMIAEAQAGKRVCFEWECRRNDGIVIDVETTVAPMHLNDSHYLLAFARDVSERRKTENDLRLSEDKLSKIFTLAPYSISIARLHDGIILDVNDAFEALTGYSRVEAVGQNGDRLALWDNKEDREAFLRELQDKKKIVDYEFVMRKKDGTLRDALNSCQEIEINGERCSLNVVRDVTEAKLVQQTMVQNEKMMSLGGLAAGMAHEINNPLGIIFQSVQGVQRRFDPELVANKDDAQAVGVNLDAVQAYMKRRNITRYLDAIVEAGQRAANIVRHMLNFSRRTESGFMDRDLGEVIRQAISLAEKDYDLKKEYDFRRVKVNLELCDGLPPVPCIASEIEQVILNLLRNAAQAMAAAGTPAPVITVRTRRCNGEAILEIEDNGPGIPSDTISRVFEPFYTTKKVGEGTGLGLSVSYFIITTTHHGDMRVDSKPGAWTRFIIRLPLERV